MSPPPQETSKRNDALSVASPVTKKPPPKPLRHTKLGHYTLLKPLARGGMGEVYLCTSGGIEGAERPCVLKLIRREHAEDKSFLARFFDEARIQAQLQHPGIAQVLEASTDSAGMPYVVLEYIEGHNLGEVRQRAAQLGVCVSWADAVAITVTVVEALTHVHERTDAKGRPLQIVHRDLSPQNIMLGYGGDVKLIDFGTARGENRRCQTVAGVVFAKPGYVAPEVANNTPGDALADVYAAGIILWELIMGRKFLTGDVEEHLAEVAAGRRSPSAVSLTNNVPLELDTIIARMTAVDVRDRFQSAREVKHALLRVLKRAPSLADGERGVRPRIAHLMSRLYPAEPARSRSEFAHLLAERRRETPPQPVIPQSPAPSRVDEERLLSGTRYRLDRELGKSEMSVVYAAEHVDLGRKVALKVLPKARCNDPRFERRFKTEARSLAKLRHPNLVHLHDFGVSLDGRPFYAMELLQGETLRQSLQRRVFAWQEAVQLSVQLCAALATAHAQGIVHRDIKPDNVFVTDAGVVKLLDFGIAQAEDEPLPINEGDSQALELTGTAEYMAPEQIGREPVDERADIYAVGALLYELLTGDLPHQADTVVALLDKKRRDMPVSPRKRAPEANLPFELNLAVLKALAPNKEHRYANIGVFAEALEGALAGPLRRRRNQSFATSLGIALVLALGVFAVLRQDRVTALLESVNLVQASEDEQQVALNAAADEAAAVELNGELAPADNDPAGEVGAAEFPETARPAADDGRSSRAAETAIAAPPAAPQSDTDIADTTEQEMSAEDALFAEKLQRAIQLSRLGGPNQDRALGLFRKLGEQRPQDPELLEHWSRTAANRKWWGESLRIAIRWASVDPSEVAYLHLAKTQRLVGQRYGAIQTLERFLEHAPDNQPATAALERYKHGR